jgi:hypothetical protein
LEPYHAMVYFAPEARAAYTALGLKGYWMGYFASRSAAMGAVPANLVTATFYNFHPRMVARSIPDAWRFSTPKRILAARYEGADVVLRKLLSERITAPELAEAVVLAREAAEGLPVNQQLYQRETENRALHRWPPSPRGSCAAPLLVRFLLHRMHSLCIRWSASSRCVIFCWR